MAQLTAASRNALSTKSFALPNRRYPIHDISHARNALARVAQYGSGQEKARVRSKVHQKYPSIRGTKPKVDRRVTLSMMRG